MKLGVLFSGGKDSTLALHKAVVKEEVACLITLISKNPESYMFHTPNISITKLQAKALNLPLVAKNTEGKQDGELMDLKKAIAQAKRKFEIEGVVSGAVESVYQAERIQKICYDLDLWCFNPLWKRDQLELLKEIVESGFNVIISGVFAYPLDEKWLGKEINRKVIGDLMSLAKDYGISPSGEGGEIETTVLDAPLFRKRLEVLSFSIESKGNSGVFSITRARLAEK
jgi:ABC transporter with metal-binding/Fe-S-binding domain ATP-binding protein